MIKNESLKRNAHECVSYLHLLIQWRARINSHINRRLYFLSNLYELREFKGTVKWIVIFNNVLMGNIKLYNIFIPRTYLHKFMKYHNLCNWLVISARQCDYSTELECYMGTVKLVLKLTRLEQGVYLRGN